MNFTTNVSKFRKLCHQTHRRIKVEAVLQPVAAFLFSNRKRSLFILEQSKYPQISTRQFHFLLKSTFSCFLSPVFLSKQIKVSICLFFMCSSILMPKENVSSQNQAERLIYFNRIESLSCWTGGKVWKVPRTTDASQKGSDVNRYWADDQLKMI